MPLILLCLFIGIPILEIAVFIQVGGVVGLWPTLAAIVATAALGSILIRHQGLAILKQAQANFASGRLPVREIFDGICLLLAGALLLTPGFITDMVGGLFLIPLFRSWIRTVVRAQFLDSNRVWMNGGAPRGHTRDDGGGSTTIEGNFTISRQEEDQRSEPQMDDNDIKHDNGVSSRWGRK